MAKSPLTVTVTVDSPYPVESRWALLHDASTWPRWMAAKSAGRDRDGSPDPGGVGAVRRVTTGPVTVREEILVSEPPNRQVYRLLGNPILRDYTGEAVLAQQQGGTRITWQATFRSPLPAPLARALVRRILTDVSTGLANAPAADYSGAAPAEA